MPEGEEDPDKIYVKWTVDSLDWVTKDTEKIVEKVTADTKEGDVILMHDCYGESVEAALQIVDIMEKQGYEFVTADELLLIDSLKEQDRRTDDKRIFKNRTFNWQ